MSNSIFIKQNDLEILRLLKAQRDAYSKSKKYHYYPLVFSVIVTIVFTITLEMCTASSINVYLKAYSKLFAIITLFAMTYCETKSKELKEKGAKIQQSIDLRLFEFPKFLNSLTQSEINKSIAEYLETDLEEFKDWYCDYSNLPFQKQVFFSQNENIQWDLELRKKYRLLLSIIIIVIIILLPIYFTIAKSAIFEILLITAWLLPFGQFLILQRINLKDNITSLKNAQREFSKIEKNFDDYEKNELNCKLCTLQGYIFENRKNSALIPNWCYNFLKKQMQKNTKNIAKLTNK